MQRFSFIFSESTEKGKFYAAFRRPATSWVRLTGHVRHQMRALHEDLVERAATDGFAALGFRVLNGAHLAPDVAPAE